MCPRRYLISPAACNVPATSETLDRRTPNHLTEKFLGQVQVAAQQVPHPQQPAAKPCFDKMTGVAGSRLLGAGEKHLLVSNEKRVEVVIRLGKLADLVCLHRRGNAHSPARWLC